MFMSRGNYSSIDELRRDMITRWFHSPISACGGKTPTECSKTASGIAELEEIFSFYDRMRKGETKENLGMDCNPPTKWARWKLGYGPGSAAEFHKEEALFNVGPSSRASIAIAEKSDVVVDAKHCNFCKKLPEQGSKLRVCSRCERRYYCSKECQTSDWKGHKAHCGEKASFLGHSAAALKVAKNERQASTGLQLYQALKERVTASHMNPDGSNPSPSWSQFLAKAREEGLIPPSSALDYSKAESFAFMKERSFTEKIFELQMRMKTDLLVESTVLQAGGSQADMARARDEIKADQALRARSIASFDGVLHPDTFRHLPYDENIKVYVTYFFVELDKRTGMKQFCIMCMTNGSKVIYIEHCKGDQRPPLIDFKKAIYMALTAPTCYGTGRSGPFKPRELFISHRWGSHFFDAIFTPLTEAGLNLYFQSRSELEAECKEAGTELDLPEDA